MNQIDDFFCSRLDQMIDLRHPQTHLRDYQGILQADAYAGFNDLYKSGKIVEAACWAHIRRKFYDIHVANPTPITTHAL